MPETSPDGPASTACESCGDQPTWESLVDRDEERWLSVCRCGRMRAFLPDAPGARPEDPLGAFLVGLERALMPASPPWVRVFLASLEGPSPTRWRYRPGPCPACGAAATFGMSAGPRPHVLAICTLCLSCGRASAAYVRAYRSTHEMPATGSAWAPPCPAVQRLRDCVFRPYAVIAEGDDGSPAEWVPTT